MRLRLSKLSMNGQTRWSRSHNKHEKIIGLEGWGRLSSSHESAGSIDRRIPHTRGGEPRGYFSREDRSRVFPAERRIRLPHDGAG